LTDSNEVQYLDLGTGLAMIQHLPPGSHVGVCVTSEPVRRRIQATFLTDGIPQWLCVYAAQDESVDKVREELESAGLPKHLDPAIMRWLRGVELYGDPTAPDFARWTRSVQGLFEDARGAGLRGLRWTGDLPIAFARRGLHETLKALEESVATQFPGPFTILCTYEEFPPSPPRALVDAFAAHSKSFNLLNTTTVNR
jgi:hypothetical protein